MKKLYLAGPMLDIPEQNFPAFHAESARLRALGYEVSNPAEINGPYPNMPYMWYIRRDLAELVKCEFVALLPNWYKSRGVNIEYATARHLEMPCVDSFTLQFPPVNVGKDEQGDW